MPLSHLLKAPSGELQTGLQLILNAVVEGLCGLDTAGKVTFCNEAFLRMTGYPPEEVVGNSLHELVHQTRPDGTKNAEPECAFEKAIQTQQPIHVAGEFLLRKQGTRFPAEYWAHPLQQAWGTTAYVVTLQDLTEIQQAKDILRQSEEKFRRILASIPDIAWTSDRNGRTMYISPKVEGVLGYTKREVCAGGNLWMGRIHPEDFGRVNRAYRRLFEDRSPFNEEYRIRRKDDVWIWVHDRAMSTREEKGVLYADGILTDITQRKLAEAELRSKTAFLEAQANSTIDGILVVDSRGKRLMQNKRLIDLFNIPSEILTSEDDQELLKHVVSLVREPESFLAKVNYLYKHPTETGRDEIELKRGTVLDRYSAPVIDKDGKYYGRIWTFRDISERKRAERELRLTQFSLENASDAIEWIDPEAHLVFVNRAACRDLECSREELLSLSIPDINPLFSQEVWQTFWNEIRIRKSMRFESQHRAKQGRIFPVEVTANYLEFDGREYCFAFVSDITERKRADRELRMMKFSLENASDAVFWINPEARIVFTNEAACRSLGYSREELLSLSIPDIDPLFPKETWEAFWKKIRTRGSTTFETQHRSKSGRVFPVEVTANYLQFDGQEYSFAFVRDIAERQAMESQLRQAQKLEGIGQLAAGIAHEINTPTQFVTDNLTFLGDSWKSIHELLKLYQTAIQEAAGSLAAGVAAGLQEAEGRCDLDFIVAEVPRAIEQGLDGAHRVSRIVRAMKEFSHPDSAEKTATDLNKAIESTITVARNEWKYVAEVTADLDPNLPAVVCYPGDINQVILNLLVNAAHAIKDLLKDGEKGRITVRTRTRGDFAEISIADTGTGIPEAIRSRVFDPFFTTKEVGKGTGQGLALAHTVVVKKHSGRLWFKTEAGLGTTFFVELPIRPADPSKEP